MKIRSVLAAAMLLMALLTQAATPTTGKQRGAWKEASILLPTPKSYTLGKGYYHGKDTLIEMVDSIEGAYDYPLDGFENEAYRLDISKRRIYIRAVTPTGVIRARQTLAQLTDAYGRPPVVSITDWPAFKLRGLMHDAGRSFISIDELRHEIDLLSRFKLNVLHWHLTDNQGFRFESKRFPQLNADSSFTRFPGLYYTQEECRNLEAYAHERGVLIIPEIDMPGHSKAFERAMGFNMSSEPGRKVLKVLLDELCTAFPLAPYIHIGADEAGTTTAFVNEMTAYLHQRGRHTVVWNPISGVNLSRENLPHVDMTSMWSTRGRKVAGMANIDLRYNYINHFDVFADLVGLYKSQVYYQSQGDAEVAGAMTAVWNDRKLPSERDIILQNNLWANALATVERCWKGGGTRYIEQGGTMLPNEGPEYDEFCDFERRLLWHKAHSLRHEPIPYVKQTNVRWRVGEQEVLATGAAIYLRHTWGSTVPSLLPDTQPGTTISAYTYIYSPFDQTAGALIEFQNYGRSENDLAPDLGQWDRKGSRIWFNDKELLPPKWLNSGRYINSETDLLNENLSVRPPLPVQLQKGWNKVLLHLPYQPAPGVRLNKWMFTFVLTDLDGRNALPDIIYSPDRLLE